MIAINFKSSKDTDEKYAMHSQSDNREIMIGKEADEVIKWLFELLLSKN